MTMATADPIAQLRAEAAARQLNCRSEAFAQHLDAQDPLRHLRQDFLIPTVRDVSMRKMHDPANAAHAGDASTSTSTSHAEGGDESCVYLCGNSLGLQPRQTRQMLTEELDVWAESGVHGHFDHRFNRPWVSIDDLVTGASARIVGAKEPEVAIMNSLTVNLHLLMASFYRPTATRFKILLEDHAFPSDNYAIASQLKWHGFDPSEGMIRLAPRKGEHTLRDQDILDAIEHHGDELALILFSGVQYYTGQLFDMAAITAASHRKGCMVGFDLAHAVGNAELHLHDWQVDFAAWCSYKYLNAGPGSIAGIFVHERHADIPRLSGWWGNREQSRFQMKPEMEMIPGAMGFRMSNPCVLAVVSLLGSLQVFEKTTMKELNEKTRLLTGYLQTLLLDTIAEFPQPPFEVITPSEPTRRGCQLSLLFTMPVKPIFARLLSAGVVCDKREPNVLRIAPVPMYNTFKDVHRFATILRQAIRDCDSQA